MPEDAARGCVGGPAVGSRVFSAEGTGLIVGGEILGITMRGLAGALPDSGKTCSGGGQIGSFRFCPCWEASHLMVPFDGHEWPA